MQSFPSMWFCEFYRVL